MRERTSERKEKKKKGDDDDNRCGELIWLNMAIVAIIPLQRGYVLKQYFKPLKNILKLFDLFAGNNRISRLLYEKVVLKATGYIYKKKRNFKEI